MVKVMILPQMFRRDIMVIETTGTQETLDEVHVVGAGKYPLIIFMPIIVCDNGYFSCKFYHKFYYKK